MSRPLTWRDWVHIPFWHCPSCFSLGFFLGVGAVMLAAATAELIGLLGPHDNSPGLIELMERLRACSQR